MSRENWEITDGELEAAFILAGWKRVRDDLGRIFWELKTPHGSQIWPEVDSHGKRRIQSNRLIYNYITGVTQK